MKILFIQPESTMHERMGFMYLSSNLKAKNHEVHMVLADSFGPEGLIEEVERFCPDIIGYSVMTSELETVLAINTALKSNSKWKFLSVFGGPHPTFAPDEMIKRDGVDAICVGEGDLAFPEFCNQVKLGKDFWNTPNFLVNHDGEIFKNPIGPLVENLDDLLFPDREIMYEADPGLRENGRKMFFGSRGCPYLCTYCFNAEYNKMTKGQGDIMRHRSPENVIEEVLKVKERYPMNTVWVDDDTFLIKPKGWIAKFCKLLKEQVGLPFDINIRPDLVKDDVISDMKEGGLNSIWMGVECGDEEIAGKVLKRHTPNQRIHRAADVLKRHKVKFVTQNMMGLPVEQAFEADLKTLDFNIALGPTYAWSSILYPFPGTEVYRYALENGYLETKEVPILETTRVSSSLKFSSKAEARRIENLHKLFGIIVNFPILRKYCETLCELPLTKVYGVFYYLWYGYSLKIKLDSFVSIRKEMVGFVGVFFRMLRKT
jgi:radical SAM superfamily enzyme YgiQ (UPF0313 family)